MLPLVCIWIIAFCGLLAAPTWIIALSTIALATISYARHQVLFRRATDLGMQDAIDQTLVSSVINALAASVAAYGCGAALRFLSLNF